jgi:hypothetical protein
MLLDPLEQEVGERLAAAGDRARSSDRAALPDRGFGNVLRDRLMVAANEREAVRDRQRGPRIAVAWSLPSLFRMPRLLPVAVAGLLLIAGVVAAREVYLAVGSRPSATPVPSVAAVASESAAEPSLTESLEPSSAPSAGESPPAATEPTAKPTKSPAPGVLSLTAIGCGGGVVLDWTAYEGAGFNHYTTLRSTGASIPAAYPPQGGAVEPGGTYTKTLAATSAVDKGAAAGTRYYYRTMAFNGDNGVLAASSVTSAVASPVGSLGALTVTTVGEGTRLAWTAFAGSESCFTWYKLVYSETNPSPSYLAGDPYLTAISARSTVSYVDPSVLKAGHSYYLRVQVIRSTELGAFLVSQTSVKTFTVPPAASPTPAPTTEPTATPGTPTPTETPTPDPSAS